MYMYHDIYIYLHIYLPHTQNLHINLIKLSFFPTPGAVNKGSSQNVWSIRYIYIYVCIYVYRSSPADERVQEPTDSE